MSHQYFAPFILCSTLSYRWLPIEKDEFHVGLMESFVYTVKNLNLPKQLGRCVASVFPSLYANEFLQVRIGLAGFPMGPFDSEITLIFVYDPFRGKGGAASRSRHREM